MRHPARRCALHAVLLLLVLASLPSSARAATAPRRLDDSTWVDRWKLANGLEVSARHIPRCRWVAIAVAYRIGRDHDPRGREGLAELACEVLFTGATSAAPERTREQIESIRPYGWTLQVSPRASIIGEVASASQFPAVLAGLAARVRSVTVTDSLVTHALGRVNADRAHRYLVAPDQTLYNRIRDVALGITDEETMRRVSGRSLQGVKAAEVRDRLRRLYVPANASLALAGDLEGADLHQLVRKLFEDIPGGAPAPDSPSPRLTAAARVVQRRGLQEPLGAIGVIAPAITDSLSPDFYLNSLLIGHYCDDFWGAGPKALPLRFKYAILADPSLAQYFPPVSPEQTDADQVGVTFQDAVEKLASSVTPPDAFDELRRNHAWILGGAFQPDLLQRMRDDTVALSTLASTLAMRALWGNESFWEGYLRRFMAPEATGGAAWVEYFEAPKNIVRMLLVPARR